MAPSGGARDPLDVLLERVDGALVRGHQLALQQIADQHGGTRAAGTPGYGASVEYVVERLSADTLFAKDAEGVVALYDAPGG